MTSALRLALALLCGACSLGNVVRDDCISSEPCVDALGLGSTCEEGYCTEPPACSVSAQCTATFGYGAACESGRCVESAVAEPRCDLSEPADLVNAFPGRTSDRLVMGAILKTHTPKERARADAARLAVREINLAGGIGGTALGLLICDNDADPDRSGETEARELTRYLAGSLALPVILGPSSSSSSIAAVNVLVNERLPSALVSPSATSAALTDQLDRFDADLDSVGLFWRTCPSDGLQGKVLAELITGEAAIDSVSVVFQNDAYGQGLQKVLLTEIPGRRGIPVFTHSFDVVDDRAALEEAIAVAMKAAEADAPDAIVIVASEASSTVVALEAAAASPALLGASFFLTDGSKDASRLFSSRNATVNDVILPAARGTAPAAPAGPLYSTFSDNLMSQFDTDASRFAFVANAYDAAYVAAFGLVRARSSAQVFDGFDVAAGLANLSTGERIEIGAAGFTAAVSLLSGGDRQIDVVGTSGELAFDAEVGEAPAKIEVWTVDPASKSFHTQAIVDPTDL